ncbi:hypothetical protein pb186bvf_007794 [Paramecium bursaria]
MLLQTRFTFLLAIFILFSADNQQKQKQMDKLHYGENFSTYQKIRYLSQIMKIN